MSTPQNERSTKPINPKIRKQTTLVLSEGSATDLTLGDLDDFMGAAYQSGATAETKLGQCEIMVEVQEQK